MALPKRKITPARAGKRRSHLGLKVNKLVECDHCHERKPTHRVCPHCGHYAGRLIVNTEGD